ncbi:diacylglycerol kinase family protein [Candidatus Dojkabacteria bacterium]|nr:diacylglycerol kinase family protein [Candidatus Dojkabacteria bacterium]
MIKKHLKSYKHAKEGFFELLTIENHNFIVELVITAVVLILALVFNLNSTEWIFVIFSCGFVLTTEIINTAIEAACDAIDTKPNAQIKLAKDVAASAVVMSAVTTLIVGLMIFTPKVIILISSVR